MGARPAAVTRPRGEALLEHGGLAFPSLDPVELSFNVS
jgi:hypothetical protein